MGGFLLLLIFNILFVELVKNASDLIYISIPSSQYNLLGWTWIWYGADNSFSSKGNEVSQEVVLPVYWILPDHDIYMAAYGNWNGHELLVGN